MNIADEYMMCCQCRLFKLLNSYNVINTIEDKNKQEEAIKEEVDSVFKNNSKTLIDRPKKNLRMQM